MEVYRAALLGTGSGSGFKKAQKAYKKNNAKTGNGTRIRIRIREKRIWYGTAESCTTAENYITVKGTLRSNAYDARKLASNVLECEVPKRATGPSIGIYN